MTTNAAELGVMAPALTKLARDLGLPLPRTGHWSKADFGKQPPTPQYPADPTLDQQDYALPVPPVRRARLSTTHEGPQPTAVAGDRSELEIPAPSNLHQANIAEHKLVATTRTAICKCKPAILTGIKGRGIFRLLVTQAVAKRACAILDELVAEIEANGWALENTDEGYAVVADGETIGFMIEEKLDRVPHVITQAELKEQAQYKRECELADRGMGYRPWRAPQIPKYDHIPGGELSVKFDHDYRPVVPGAPFPTASDSA